MVILDYITLKKNALNSFFSNANDMQKQAIFKVDGAVLIIAGAGSGKTTVLVNRIANMMRFGNAFHDTEVRSLSAEQEQFLAEFPNMEKTPENAEKLAEIIAVRPINPWNILAITFTNKAANELKNRLIEKIGEGAEKINASTFHSACVKILRREINHLGYQNSFTIYDDDDSKRVIKDVMKNLNIDEKLFNPKVIRNKISSCKDKLIPPEKYIGMAKDMCELSEIRAAEVYKAYQQALTASNALDFDDIIYLTVKLFEEHPDVLQHYRNLYKYIMVDEYQDTNVAQYKLVSLLTGDSGNLCVVGDDDQSIYRFRGATIENILSFEKQYKDCTVIRLEQNYRSTENILNAANEVIRHNKTRKDKALWSELGEGEKIKCQRFESEAGEARFIVDTILNGVKDGKKYSDYAVLYRKNAQSRSFEGTMARSGIPYRIVGGVRFYDRKEIKDIMAYLSLLNNPHDIVRFRRIVNEPKRSLGDATVEEVIRISQGLGISPLDVCRNAAEYDTLSRKAGPLKAFSNIFDELYDECDNLKLDELIDAAAKKSGYIDALKAQGPEGETRIENINELKSNALAMLEEDDSITLPDFLEQVALVSDLDNFDDSSDYVSLMTMHSAKGLEFDTVFLVAAEDNIFPDIRSIGNTADMEEERRLAYVAITRAKRNLFVTHTAYRMLYGQTMRNRLSTFIREIPELLIEHIEDEKKSSFNTGMTFTKPVKRDYLAEQAAKKTVTPAASTVGAVFEVGDRIHHNTFGDGTITEAKRMGNDTMVTIEFDSIGKKKLMANFAKLTKI